MKTPQDWSDYYTSGKDFGHISEETLNYILSNVTTSLPKTCIDLGCGTGQLSRELSRYGYSCLGVDISEEAIRIAKQLALDEDVQYKLLDLERPFSASTALRGKTFSLAISRFVIAFIQNQQRFIAEARILLRPGGIFALITPTYTNQNRPTPISVSFEATLQILKDCFLDVSYTTSSNSITCYICKK